MSLETIKVVDSMVHNFCKYVTYDTSMYARYPFPSIHVVSLDS